ncbi:nucleotide-binding universal stress UspA family protein [Rhodobium orientis]|uniref:UspA domain-containing protein n=1 Tax=Rhodobium orientis TaxID=34017 RepID=A0A327JPY7_9HYPH|nr:universal stress protein [Rhodobium orientis]MBB4303736.1 nucleotide-binding universal stress UspA family protein [Rhodobium orientis]MBK5951809.1 hypothetical protein [Rhodobium orientis]RAI28519.1 hypothetical protein CH339_06455 [Rhodobium orientis]
MTKTILIPVDISQIDAAKAALRFARQTLNLGEAHCVLLNVMPQIPAYITAELPGELVGQTRDDTANSLSSLAMGEGLRDFKTVVRDGHAGREILDVASKLKPDLILMSSHDPGLADYFLGSVAAYVVRHAHTSVLIVREPAK